MTTDTLANTEWTAADLHSKLDAEEGFFVFDVRDQSEFEAGKIEGKAVVPTENVPYYEMLEFDEFGDVVDSFKAFFEAGAVEKIPRDVAILVVCATGVTSEYVAEALRRLHFEAFNLKGGTAAWGDYYHVEPVVEGELSIYQVSRPARGCLSYLAVANSQAVVIDPLRHIEHYEQFATDNGFEIVLVLDTHGHADHISGGPTLARELGVPYHLHPYDGIHPIDVLPAKISYDYLSDGQTFTVGGKRLETLHIPGHTLGNVAYLLDGKYLFAGDSIFIESIARPDLGGHGDTWASLHYSSLRRLLELPAATTVLPAHFSGLGEGGDNGLFVASLGQLAASNQGLLMAQKSEEEFVAYILASLPKFPEEYIDIKRVNAGLMQVGGSKASELELGKNICALAQAYEELTS